MCVCVHVRACMRVSGGRRISGVCMPCSLSRILFTMYFSIHTAKKLVTKTKMYLICCKNNQISFHYFSQQRFTQHLMRRVDNFAKYICIYQSLLCNVDITVLLFKFLKFEGKNYYFCQHNYYHKLSKQNS